jgi:hypothetical protein
MSFFHLHLISPKCYVPEIMNLRIMATAYAVHFRAKQEQFWKHKIAYHRQLCRRRAVGSFFMDCSGVGVFPKRMRDAPQAISRSDEHFACSPASARPAEALGVNTAVVDDEFGCCLDVHHTSHGREHEPIQAMAAVAPAPARRKSQQSALCVPFISKWI